MTSHEEWLIVLDTSKRTKVKLAASRTSTIEGVGNIVIKREDEKARPVKQVHGKKDMYFYFFRIKQKD